FFQAEDGIRDRNVTGVQTCALPILWFMYVDGGEPWQLTKHKSGVRSFEFSPDGKTLLLVATVPETEDQEKRTKNKDDAEVVDHRSEERRVGKECRARLWREQQKKKE